MVSSWSCAAGRPIAAFVFGGAIVVKGGNYKEYLMAGILIQAALAYAAMGPASSVATDFQSGSIDRFRSLPIPRSAYLLGHFFAEMLGAILTIAILIGTGLLVGWRSHTGILEVTEAVLLLLVFSAAIMWLGLWLGIVVRSPDTVMGIGFVIVLPLTFISTRSCPSAPCPECSSRSRV